MQRYCIKWSMDTGCRLHRDVLHPCMISCWSVGIRWAIQTSKKCEAFLFVPKQLSFNCLVFRTQSKDRLLRLCSGSWRTSLQCQTRSTKTRQPTSWAQYWPYSCTFKICLYPTMPHHRGTYIIPLYGLVPYLYLANFYTFYYSILKYPGNTLEPTCNAECNLGKLHSNTTLQTWGC